MDDGWYADAYAKQHQSEIAVATQRQDMRIPSEHFKGLKNEVLKRPAPAMSLVGVNHEGNVDAALKWLLWRLAPCGKVQSYTPDRFISGDMMPDLNVAVWLKRGGPSST